MREIKRQKIDKLLLRNQELNTMLMQKSAELIETKEELEELKLKVKLHGAHRDHNKCWQNDRRLHDAVEKGLSPWPDPQNISLPEMLWGCSVYCPGAFPKLSKKELQMVAELKEVIKKYMY